MVTTKGVIEVRRRRQEDELARLNRRRGKPTSKYFDLLRMFDVVVAPMNNPHLAFEIRIGEIGPYLDVKKIWCVGARDAYESLSPTSRSKDDTRRIEDLLREHAAYGASVKYDKEDIRIMLWAEGATLSEGARGIEEIDLLLREHFPYYESDILQPKA